jgi:hypothetical protein
MLFSPHNIAGNYKSPGDYQHYLLGSPGLLSRRVTEKVFGRLLLDQHLDDKTGTLEAKCL